MQKHFLLWDAWLVEDLLKCLTRLSANNEPMTVEVVVVEGGNVANELGLVMFINLVLGV